MDQNKGEGFGACATVKIVAGDSFAVINEADFNPAKHKKYVEQAEEPQAPKTDAKAKK